MDATETPYPIASLGSGEPASYTFYATMVFDHTAASAAEGQLRWQRYKTNGAEEHTPEGPFCKPRLITGPARVGKPPHTPDNSLRPANPGAQVATSVLQVPKRAVQNGCGRSGSPSCSEPAGASLRTPASTDRAESTRNVILKPGGAQVTDYGASQCKDPTLRTSEWGTATLKTVPPTPTIKQIKRDTA